VGWTPEDGLNGCRLDDPPRVHHGNPIGHFGYDSKIVGDQKDSHAELVAQAIQQIEDLCLHGHIEGGRRLVCNEDIRLKGYGHGDEDSLPHAPRELVRVVVDPPFRSRDPHGAEQLDRTFSCCLGSKPTVHAKEFADLITDRQHWIQGRESVLKHKADPIPTHGAPLVFGKPEHVLAGQSEALSTDCHTRTAQKTHNRAGRHGLPGARLALYGK
jgi:hypothetical protein